MKWCFFQSSSRPSSTSANPQPYPLPPRFTTCPPCLPALCDQQEEGGKETCSKKGQDASRRRRYPEDLSAVLREILPPPPRGTRRVSGGRGFREVVR